MPRYESMNQGENMYQHDGSNQGWSRRQGHSSREKEDFYLRERYRGDDFELREDLYQHDESPNQSEKKISMPAVSQDQLGRTPWVSISWRFISSVIFAGLIIAVLYGFERKGELTRWERRWFNMLTILFSSLVSLSLGSLLGLLGAMIRWPLLAKAAHSHFDVDLIMGMANPTGSLRLVIEHGFRSRKWTKTTTVTLIYLVYNIIGRLTVAGFGLTYDVNEVVSFPVTVADWGSPDWYNVRSEALRGDTYDLSTMLSTSEPMLRFAAVARGQVRNDSGVVLNSDGRVTLESRVNISGLGLDRTVEGETIKYSYALKEYQGTETRQSQKILQSQSKCEEKTILEGEVYVGGKKIQVPGTRDEFGWVIDRILTPVLEWYSVGGSDSDPTWMAKVDWGKLSQSSGCATTYIYFGRQFMIDSKTNMLTLVNGTIWQCNTCLEHGGGEAGLGPDTLHNLPIKNTPYVENMLLRLGAWDDFLYYGATEKYEHPTDLLMRQYPRRNLERFLDALDESLQQHRREALDTPSGPSNPDLKLSLQAAHVTAWLPLLAIIGAETQLPRVAKDGGSQEQPYLTFALEIKWRRAGGVLFFILGWEVLAIVLAVQKCRGIPVRDHDSYLAAGRILRSGLNKIEGGSGATGVELAEVLDAHLARHHGRPGLRYGARKAADGLYEVDLVQTDDYREFPPGSYK